MSKTKIKWFYHCENLFKMTKHDINNIIWCIKFEYDFIHQDKWNVNVLMRSTFDMLTNSFRKHCIKHTLGSLGVLSKSVEYIFSSKNIKWLEKVKQNTYFCVSFSFEIYHRHCTYFQFLFFFVL